MPIYEFVCDHCGKSFEELFRRHDEEKVVTCPACGTVEVSRKLSVFGFGGDVQTLPMASGGCSTCSGGSCSSCH